MQNQSFITAITFKIESSNKKLKFQNQGRALLYETWSHTRRAYAQTVLRETFSFKLWQTLQNLTIFVWRVRLHASLFIQKEWDIYMTVFISGIDKYVYHFIISVYFFYFYLNGHHRSSWGLIIGNPLLVSTLSIFLCCIYSKNT